MASVLRYTPGMRRSGIRLVAIAVGLSLLFEGIPVQALDTPPFSDMATSYYGYQENVAYLKAKGAIEGRPDGLFHPKDTVNRAEFLKLVFSSKVDTEPVAGDCFADVPADAWFAPFVCAAKRRGIVKGYKVGSREIFQPEQPIVFSEAIKMVVLAYGEEVSEPKGEFWYKPYADSLDEHKILERWSYVPWDPINRERAADLIARFVKHDEDRLQPNLSPGCGKNETTPSLKVTVRGIERSYLLTKARTANSNTPSPLMIAFHGRTNSNAQIRNYFGLDKAATKYFIAYPAALSNGKGSFNWSEGGDKAAELRDFELFDGIVKQLGESYCIDMNRIFVVGHSLGGWFANSVACARGGIVRGSATVGGSTTMSNCSGPSAAMIINNPKDTLSSHPEATKMRDIRITENTCSYTTRTVEPAYLSCIQYSNCTQNPVVFCPHTNDYERDGTYYPHVWPQGTASAMVKFFDSLQ